MVDAYLNIVAAKIGMPPHTLKVTLAVSCVSIYFWECFKNWIAPRMIAWHTWKEGPEPKLIATNAMKIPGSFGEIGKKPS